MTRQRRRFSGDEKVAILRRHLLEKVPISELCDEHHLAPNVFYRWQKEFFENGAAACACPVRGLSSQAKPHTRASAGVSLVDTVRTARTEATA